MLGQVDSRQYEELIASVVEADRVFVAGAGRSLLMVKAFAMRLMHIGKPVYAVRETVTPAAGEKPTF